MTGDAPAGALAGLGARGLALALLSEEALCGCRAKCRTRGGEVAGSEGRSMGRRPSSCFPVICPAQVHAAAWTPGRAWRLRSSPGRRSHMAGVRPGPGKGAGGGRAGWSEVAGWGQGGRRRGYCRSLQWGTGEGARAPGTVPSGQCSWTPPRVRSHPLSLLGTTQSTLLRALTRGRRALFAGTLGSSVSTTPQPSHSVPERTPGPIPLPPPSPVHRIPGPSLFAPMWDYHWKSFC